MKEIFLKNTLNRCMRAAALAGFLMLGTDGFAQGSAFSYQGRLNSGSLPVTGIYDVRFELYDAFTGGLLIAGPKTNSSVAVTNGLFTVQIDVGAIAFSGPDRWLEIGVRTNGASSFDTLSARQPILTTPYAITAGNLSGNLAAGQVSGTLNSIQIPNLDASKITTGTMSDARLSANVPLLSADQTFLGATEFANASNSFNGNGGRLTGLDASQLTVGTVPLARLSGVVVTNLQAGVTFSGTFSGNGAGLTNTPTANNYVHAYKTTSQTVSFANLFQNITFTLNGQINGWGHTAGSASFTNNQAGVYLVTYAAEVGIIVGTPQTAVFKANQNGVEIVGSQWSTVASDDLPVFGSKSFIVNLNSLDVLTFQFGGTSTTVQLIGSSLMGTSVPSASVTIVRIQ